MMRSVAAVVLLVLTCAATGGAHASKIGLRGLKGVPTDPTSSQGSSITSGWKWSPGYVSATLADAIAQVMQIKAQGKYNRTLPTIISPTFTPSPTPIKTASKTFAYTSIKLNVEAAANAVPSLSPSPSPSPLLASTSVPTAVSGAASTNAAVSGAASTNAAVSGATVTKTPLETVPTSGRKLLGMPGLTGWDPGALFQQKIDLLTSETAALQQKISNGAANAQAKFQQKLSASDQKLGAITDYVSNSVFAKEDAARAALNAYQQSAQTRAQDLQNMVSSLMSAHTLLSEAKLGILNQG